MPLFRSREEQERVPLVTTDGVPGLDVVSVVGFVSGNASNPAGALDRMEQEAADWEAEAVVGVRVASSSRGGAFVGDDHVFAYGTAVKLRPRS